MKTILQEFTDFRGVELGVDRLRRYPVRTDLLGFENIVCGVVKYLDKFYVIYGVPRKDLVPLKQENKSGLG